MLIDYPNDIRQMGDILLDSNIDIRRDFTDEERNTILNHLIDYIRSENDEPIIIELKDTHIRIDGKGAYALIYAFNA